MTIQLGSRNRTSRPSRVTGLYTSRVPSPCGVTAGNKQLTAKLGFSVLVVIVVVVM